MHNKVEHKSNYTFSHSSFFNCKLHQENCITEKNIHITSSQKLQMHSHASSHSVMITVKFAFCKTKVLHFSKYF